VRRDAGDLELAMHVLIGLGGRQQTAWRVELPPPRHRRLVEFRVAVWRDWPLCPGDASMSERLDGAIAALRRAGAEIDEAARPAIDDGEHQQLFMLLLRAATASRMGDADFAEQLAITATLGPDDMSTQ